MRLTNLVVLPFTVLLLCAGPAPTRAQNGWTAGATHRAKAVTPPAILHAVRTGGHPGFDRTVWEFRGGVPGYHIEYVDRPVRMCGSGNPTPLAGHGWLEVRMEPADAHDQQGRAAVARRQLAPRLPILRELKQTCDFEAQVVWTLGVARPNRYRVFELSNPARLVVDVRR